jgi:cell division protein FtsB
VSDSSEPLSPARAPRLATRGSRIVRLALIVVAAVVLVDALVGEKGLMATIRARREYTELAAQIARTRGENARLREVARGLREDPNAIEELARRELGLIRPGETLFIIKDVAPAK